MRRRARLRRVAGIAAAASLGGLWLWRAPEPPIDVIRSLDAFGGSVLVMNREDEGATVIWMIDEEGRMIDEEGRMIDEEGRMIEEESRMIEEEGRMIDEKGGMIDESRRTGDAPQPGRAEAGSALAP